MHGSRNHRLFFCGEEESPLKQTQFFLASQDCCSVKKKYAKDVSITKS